jgi:serine/threonine-protein kinase
VTHALFIPARDEHWTLIERLGRGGEAEAWRARRLTPLLADEVCVKIPLALPDDAGRRAILEEARVMSRVRHANVASLLDVVEDAHGRPILVLELIRGADLRRVQRQLLADEASFPAAVIAAVGRAISRALAAAGRALPGGLVHRDVTPHNVLLSLEGEIKLADFGVTRALERERWTRSGHLKGKCAYMAPESVRGAPLTPQADVFSLGVILFELCAGTRPFVARSFLEQVDALLSNQRPALAPLAAHVPPQLVELVEQMLAADPERRPTPDEIARALGQLSDEECALDWIRNAVRRTRGPSLARVIEGRPSSDASPARSSLGTSKRAQRAR